MKGWAAMYDGGVEVSAVHKQGYSSNMLVSHGQYLGIVHELEHELVQEVLSIPLDVVKPGSGHGGEGYAEGWIEDLSMTRLFQRTASERVTANWMSNYPWVSAAVKTLRKYFNYELALTQVMVNRLGPFSTLNRHRDGPTTDLRFHYPIVTNSGVLWWDEVYGTQRFATGFWWGPVQFSGVLHSMANQGESARYHLVVDLAVKY